MAMRKGPGKRPADSSGLRSSFPDMLLGPEKNLRTELGVQWGQEVRGGASVDPLPRGSFPPGAVCQWGERADLGSAPASLVADCDLALGALSL